MNAVGAVGLALYNFGQTVSIPFFTDSWRPDSWMERIHENMELGLHTLCLLDIKVKEQSEENLARLVFPFSTTRFFFFFETSADHLSYFSCRGRKIFEPPRYMSIPCALSQLLSLLEEVSPVDDDSTSEPKAFSLPLSLSSLIITTSRLGDPSQTLVSGTLEELSKLDEEAFGGPLHSFVIVGKRFHALERDFARRWSVNPGEWDRVAKEVYGVRD